MRTAWTLGHTSGRRSRVRIGCGGVSRFRSEPLRPDGSRVRGMCARDSDFASSVMPLMGRESCRAAQLRRTPKMARSLFFDFAAGRARRNEQRTTGRTTYLARLSAMQYQTQVQVFRFDQVPFLRHHLNHVCANASHIAVPSCTAACDVRHAAMRLGCIEARRRSEYHPSVADGH